MNIKKSICLLFSILFIIFIAIVLFDDLFLFNQNISPNKTENINTAQQESLYLQANKNKTPSENDAIVGISPEQGFASYYGLVGFKVEESGNALILDASVENTLQRIWHDYSDSTLIKARKSYIGYVTNYLPLAAQQHAISVFDRYISYKESDVERMQLLLEDSRLSGSPTNVKLDMYPYEQYLAESFSAQIHTFGEEEAFALFSKQNEIAQQSLDLMKILNDPDIENAEHTMNAFIESLNENISELEIETGERSPRAMGPNQQGE